MKDNVVDKVDDVMKFINEQETTCNDIDNTINTSSVKIKTINKPAIGSMEWLTNSIGINNINIPSNPKKNQGFTPVGDAYKPTNRGYLTGFLNDGFNNRDAFSGMKDTYRKFIRENSGLNKLNDYINSLNSNVNEWVNKIHSNTNKSQCVNKKNVLKDSTVIINEISKLLVIPGVFWMTNNIFYISIYQNENCYRPELPDVWDYFISFDKKMGGNSLLSSVPKYIFEFAIYAPHYINQAIRKVICNLPFRESFVVFYYALILFIVIVFKGVVNTHLFVADSILMNDTQLTGIAFIITLFAGLQYWYVNWYNNILFKFGGPITGLIFFLLIIIMLVINLIFVSNMYNLGLYDDLKKGNTIMHNIKKYMFYFIYEISIIGIMAVSILNFNNIKDERIQRAFQYSYGFFIILILIHSSIRYSWDPPITSNDMSFFEKFINDYILATLFNGSMEYLNEFYSHTELSNCEIERLKNPDDYKECDVKILDEKINKPLFSKGIDFFTNTFKSVFGSKKNNSANTNPSDVNPLSDLNKNDLIKNLIIPNKDGMDKLTNNVSNFINKDGIIDKLKNVSINTNGIMDNLNNNQLNDLKNSFNNFSTNIPPISPTISQMNIPTNIQNNNIQTK